MIALIGDLHIGVKGASKHHHETYMKVILKDIFRYLEDNNIKFVIQLGDTFDDRKFLHHWAWEFCKETIVAEVARLGLTWYCIVGNHDSHYRDTLKINTPRQHLDGKPGFVIIDEPTEVNILGEEFLLLPWINKDNSSRVLDAVENSKAKYAAGHFEFNGFDLYRGQPSRSHYSHSIYAKFDRVYSGHYHTFSHKDNVVYAGTPYELTWQDSEDEKFFLIHEKSGYSKIPTKKTLYQKIYYSFGMQGLDEEDVKDKYIRVIVGERQDKAIFNKFIHSLEEMGPFDLKIMETFDDVLSETVSTVEMKDTKAVISEYLDNSEIDLDKKKIMDIFDQLYNEALSSE